MSVLMRSVSGVRGIVGETLTPSMLVRYVNAFVQEVGRGRILVGRDSRDSGEMVEQAVASALVASGCDAVLLGLATTPTVEMAVMADDLAVGGLILTASHNPAQWNALKMLDREGIFLGPDAIQRLFARVDAGEERWVGHEELGRVERFDGADALHVEKILSLPYIHADAIRAKRFRVVADCVNGAASRIAPGLLGALGCECVAIHDVPDGRFPRGAEPVPEALGILGAKVRETGAALGLAFDPDGDRLALVDEKGEPLGEEYTLALAVDLVLSDRPGPVTVNLSTSEMSGDIARARGVAFARAKVGEINVTYAMKDNGSVVGGEGNGGLILPELHYGRDGVLATAIVLEALARSGKTLSQLAAELSRYEIVKRKFDLAGKSLGASIERLRTKFDGALFDERDGFWIQRDRSWVHLRASNTEPVLRVIAEAPTAAEAQALCAAVEEEI